MHLRWTRWSNCIHYSSYSVQLYTRIAIWIINPTNRAAGAHTDEWRLCRHKSRSKRAWPHGTSATPSRCPIRQTSHQLSAAAAGVVADVEVVPVAAAGNAVADGRSSATSSSLEDSSEQSVSVRYDSRRVGTECAYTIWSRTVKRMFWCVARSSDSFSFSDAEAPSRWIKDGVEWFFSGQTYTFE